MSSFVPELSSLSDVELVSAAEHTPYELWAESGPSRGFDAQMFVERSQEL